ncbi:uncharacterized protein LOC142610425 [Castanea sativa]|uniref:uncharacterized protein LOC142610425 n=1 Tax=Castanea sativa TaxID=21020 RepID=UPI003F6507D4
MGGSLQAQIRGRDGFKDLGWFNDAMFAKHVWRLLKDQSSLFYRVFKAKYFPSGSIIEALVATGSYAWPELDGAKVVALINLATHSWDQNLVNQNFLVFEANRIKAIPLCWIDQCDRIIWPDTPDGEYSVKAGYQKLCEEANVSNASSSDPSHQKFFWKKIWKLHVPNKIKNFLWRICSNALLIKENMKKRRIIEDVRCSACLLE